MKFDRIINAITATAFLFRKVYRPIGLIIGAIMFAMLSVKNFQTRQAVIGPV